MMGKRVSTDAVQVVTTIAVVVGLALVIYELRQTSQIAKAQLLSDGFTIEMDRTNVLMGENPMEAVATACVSPRELTLAQSQVLSVYFNGLLFRSVRQKRIAQETGFFDEIWDAQLPATFRLIMRTHYGRIWWQERRQVWLSRDPEVLKAGDRQYELPIDPNVCRTLYDRHREIIETSGHRS